MGHQLLATGTRTAQIGCSVQRLNKRRPPSRMVKDVGWLLFPRGHSLQLLDGAVALGTLVSSPGTSPGTTRREHAGCRLVVTIPFSWVLSSYGNSKVGDLEHRQQRVIASKGAGGTSGASALAVTSPCWVLWGLHLTPHPVPRSEVPEGLQYLGCPSFFCPSLLGRPLPCLAPTTTSARIIILGP